MFRSLTVATPCHRLLSIMLACTVYSATAVYILFTFLSALLCSPCYHHAATLGSATVLTILHRPYPLRVTLVACATTSPLRESTLTPCRLHHPYRSLTLAHRVVPPLVVPVPSLAVLVSACPWWFPLLVSLRSLTLAYRLTPMVTCCSLSARPHIMHHYLPALPLVRIHVSILFSCLSARLLTLLCSVFHPVLPA